jgi:hypothetical protein
MLSPVSPQTPDAAAGARHARAWIALVAVLALHVVDEAFTGFLDFYNPLVRDIRASVAWFPMPTFTLGPWLAGLTAAVALLGLATPAVGRGATGTWLASWIFGGIMIVNGVGHLLGSVYFGRWLPGATTGPLLVVAGAWLLRRAWEHPPGP